MNFPRKYLLGRSVMLTEHKTWDDDPAFNPGELFNAFFERFETIQSYWNSENFQLRDSHISSNFGT